MNGNITVEEITAYYKGREREGKECNTWKAFLIILNMFIGRHLSVLANIKNLTNGWGEKKVPDRVAKVSYGGDIGKQKWPQSFRETDSAGSPFVHRLPCWAFKSDILKQLH